MVFHCSLVDVGVTLAMESSGEFWEASALRCHEIKSQWTSTGYADKLKKATEGTGLEGPLNAPYEPWHYGIPFGR